MRARWARSRRRRAIPEAPRTIASRATVAGTAPPTRTTATDRRVQRSPLLVSSPGHPAPVAFTPREVRAWRDEHRHAVEDHALGSKRRRGAAERPQELIAVALEKWTDLHAVKLDFVQPGKPPQNAHVESFDGGFRDECLAPARFPTLARTRAEIELGARRLQQSRRVTSGGRRGGRATEDPPLSWTPRMARRCARSVRR